MGIVDVAFNKKATHLAVSGMDSTIKVFDLTQSNIQYIQNNTRIFNAVSCRTGNYVF